MSFLIGVAVYATYEKLHGAKMDEAIIAIDMSKHQETMASCIDNVLKAAAISKFNFGSYEKTWRLCGNQIFNGLYLDDFLVRRQKFLDQRLDERVNLFLVVAITLSGVGLAALQLLMSYRLAINNISAFEKESELAVEAGKISVKSSVTGLLILALSLAFFMIYVVYIYSIKEVALSRPDNLQAPAETAEHDTSNRSGSASAAGPAPSSTAPPGQK